MRISRKGRGGESAEGPITGSLRLFRDEMDRLFSRFFNDPWLLPEMTGGPAAAWSPDIDVLEGYKDITVRAEIPGLDPKDIEVSLAGNLLTITGEKREENEDQGSGFYRSERRYGAFHRSVELPQDADPDQIKASYDKGVLTIHVGRKEGAKPRRIAVSGRKAEAPEPPKAEEPPKSEEPPRE